MAKERWLGATEPLEAAHSVRFRRRPLAISHRSCQQRSLVEYARERLSRQLAACGASPEAVEGARHLFDPHALTLGFARRFATYKRPNLLLHDPQRLQRLLNHPERPVQLIIAGKAHPNDRAGQALIQEWINFIRRPEVRPHIVFLSDYDMLLTEHLVQGVDVWINTPRRPWEAMWHERHEGARQRRHQSVGAGWMVGGSAYTPDVGWALGDGREHGDDPALGTPLRPMSLYDVAGAGSDSRSFIIATQTGRSHLHGSIAHEGKHGQA